MPLTDIRVPPLDDNDWDEDLHPMRDFWRKSGSVFNIFKTIAHHPKLMKRWMVFSNHTFSKSTLSDRDREIVIMRTGWLAKCDYEFAQHVPIAQRAGMDDKDFENIKSGPDAAGISTHDALLLRAVDELVNDTFLCDETWQALTNDYSVQQITDIIFTVGNYNMLAMALNSFGVQIDEDIKPIELPKGAN